MESTTLSPPHVAFAAFPFGTHAAPLFCLARALASLSPSSHFSFFSTNRSLVSLQRVFSSVPSNIQFITISDGLQDGAPDGIEAQVGLFLKSFKQSLHEGLKAAELARCTKVNCVVSDAFLWRAGDLADELELKWVSVWTGGPQGLSAHLHADLIRETVGVGHEAVKSYGDKTLDFVPGLSHHRACDLQEGVIIGDLNSPFSNMLDRMAHRIPNSNAVVLNTIQDLDPTIDTAFTDKFVNYVPVGPFHLLGQSELNSEPCNDPHGCLQWLDQHPKSSVAYISFGTVMTPPPSEILELAKGLEVSCTPFLWSMNERAQSLLPPGFIDRSKESGKGKIVTWAPQSDVLGHNTVGLFVSHCGWNSVMESIVGGVPMVCRPFFADQMVNARAISHVWKFGVSLDGGVFTEEGVVRAFDVVLNGEDGRRMRVQARKLKGMAIAAIETNGTSMENLKKLLKIVCQC
ncbi:hypothetical protein LUZ60_001100 [Juncus effusus]|nr:hypothetical protein LUZ60_001100 [Juncus effusus]